MQHLIPYIQPAGTVALVGVCIALIRMQNGKMQKKVDREVCHTVIKGVEDKFHYINEDLKEIKADIKSLLKR